MKRPSGRSPDQMRSVKITRHFSRHAEGSVLVEFGSTKVICTASVEAGVPRFLRGQGKGWVTAEYGMLPRSTNSRMAREAVRGKQSGRTQEIQRLIGRSLRACVDLNHLGENTIHVDCDVIEADGGTRTASITGACVALVDATQYLLRTSAIEKDPVLSLIASVSVGVYSGLAVVDLDYFEDSRADTDMNVVMNGDGGFVEIQGTAEGNPFSIVQLEDMMNLAKLSIHKLVQIQSDSLGL